MDVTIVEMGVEEKMAPEDQHGGYMAHPTVESLAMWASVGDGSALLVAYYSVL